MLLAGVPAGAPTAGAVVARAGGENFPVASRLLPRRERSHLLAMYGFARLVDELGDSIAGDRMAALDWLERELDLAFEGRASHPLMVRLQPSLRECALPREPFARLIEANRVDQRVRRYETWEQLRGYCALSANPVGELVLHVLGVATPARIALSDSICTALQLTEHCQDVAEDFASGRVYLPAEDMARFGCSTADLDAAGNGRAARGSEPLRAVLAFEVARARELLADGMPLMDELRGRQRLAVAAFVAGGRAALGAIERARYEVLAGAPHAGSGRRALALASLLAERRLARAGAVAGRRAPAAGSAPAIAAAYRYCESVTRTQAANFYYGIRLLARDRRRAMCAVYTFARRVDDIGDGSAEVTQKLHQLDVQARALRALESPGAGLREGSDPVMVALADAHARYSLPIAALGELIEGVRMDVNGVAYERFEDLVVYCRRVAGAIGRVCLAVFGAPGLDAAGGLEAARLADELGVAMQLTNILRDLREDAERGRIYLPAEDLRRFGVIGHSGSGPDPQALASPALIHFEADRARAAFQRGLRLVPMLDRRAGACVLAMSGIYRRLLDRIAADPQRVLSGRVSLPAHEKLWVAARSMLGGGG
jgi:15-cis-phytoene synthase